MKKLTRTKPAGISSDEARDHLAKVAKVVTGTLDPNVEGRFIRCFDAVVRVLGEKEAYKIIRPHRLDKEQVAQMRQNCHDGRVRQISDLALKAEREANPVGLELALSLAERAIGEGAEPPPVLHRVARHLRVEIDPEVYPLTAEAFTVGSPVDTGSARA